MLVGPREPLRAKLRTLLTRAASAEGVTPLEVMLKAMREHYGKREYDAAAAIAKDAAPYMHPKLASVEHSGPGGSPIAISISAEDAEL
ncbi:hypothetical protein [Agrobacterium tumefaciens]|uniref:hypothetical protein n=1 Tax=Agrobacterium tumefaciens TaxID=358 RepID=UPI001668AD22